MANNIDNWLNSIEQIANIIHTQPYKEKRNGKLIYRLIEIIQKKTQFIPQQKIHWQLILHDLKRINISLKSIQKQTIIDQKCDQNTALNIIAKLKTYLQQQQFITNIKTYIRQQYNTIQNSTTFIQLILLSIVNAIPIQIKQAISLFNHHAKYLIFLLTKGYHQKYQPIQLILQNINKYLVQVMRKQNNLTYMQFMVKIFKCGLNSHQQSIRNLSFQLCSKILQNLPMDLSIQIYRQHLMDNNIYVQEINKYGSLFINIVGYTQNILSLVLEVDNINRFGLCKQIIRQIIDENRELKMYQDVNRVMKVCMQQVLKKVNVEQNVQMILLVLGGGIVMQQQLLQLVDGIINRSREQMIVKSSIYYINMSVFILGMIDILANKKNRLASLIYKATIKYIFNFINHQQSSLFVNNLMQIIQKYPKIPVDTLIHYLNQTYQNNISINQTHLFLMKILITHNLNTQQIVIITHVLIHILLSHLYFSHTIFPILNNIIINYTYIPIQHQIIYFVQSLFQQFTSNSQTLQKSKHNPNLKKSINILIHHNIVLIIQLKIQSVSNHIKSLITKYYTQYPKSNILFNNLLTLLNPSNNTIESPNSRDKESDKLLLINSVKKNEVNIDALIGLQKYKDYYRNKSEKVKKIELMEVQSELRKKILSKKLQIDMLQNGYSLKKNQQILLFQFDSKQMKLHNSNNKRYFIHPSQLQQIQIASTQHLIKKYRKLLRHLYFRYSNTTMEDSSVQQNYIKFPSLWKLLKDHKIDQFITIQQCQQIVKIINKNSNNKIDLLNLDYLHFQIFFQQLSQFIFSRPPIDLSHKYTSFQFQSFIQILKQNCNTTVINIQLFDDPDAVYFNQTELIKQLNKKLQKNPNYILPQGYKKIVKKQITFNYQIKQKRTINQNFIFVYQIFDSIFQQIFSIHLIQPISNQIQKNKVRPNLIQSEKSAYSLQSNLNYQVKLQEKQKKFSYFLKMQILKYPIKQRPLVIDIASVIQQIVYAVECGHNKIGLKKQNAAVKAQKQKQLINAQELKQLDIRRKQRQEQLQMQIRELRDKKMQKSQKQRKEKKLKQEQQRIKRQKEIQRMKMIKQKLQQYKNRRQNEVIQGDRKSVQVIVDDSSKKLDNKLVKKSISLKKLNNNDKSNVMVLKFSTNKNLLKIK